MNDYIKPDTALLQENPPSSLATILADHLSTTRITDAQKIARQTALPLHQVLLARGFLSQRDFLKALSQYFGVGHYRGTGLVATPAPKQDHTLYAYYNAPTHQGPETETEPVLLVCPQYLDPETLHQIVLRAKSKKQKCLLTDRDSFRIATENASRDNLLHQAIHGLEQEFPDSSACTVLSRQQKLAGLFILSALSAGVTIQSFHIFYWLGLALTPLFMSVILLRLWAVFHLLYPEQQSPHSPSTTRADHNLPVYTILVPLYKEDRVLVSLTKALQGLDYPPERLDIKLLLEQADTRTIEKAQSLGLPPCFELVIVPDSLPRTKPKALNYGLHFARGDYLVIYDAEDRPDPDQLRLALDSFRQDEQNPDQKKLACVQARLNTYNAHTNWLTRQFTQEYSALFGGILPALTRLGLPFLLGGTSNHFRTDYLKQSGGWDAFNVTEDADLGIRLYRAGYSCSTIDSTTWEESCTQFPNWFCQRTRWVKGWMQTWCVHMRHPRLLWQELGTKGFLTFQVLLGGQILSALGYLACLLLLIVHLTAGTSLPDSFRETAPHFFLLSSGLFMLGYFITGWLGILALRRQRNRNLLRTILWTPLYWATISLAACRATGQLFTNPFHWEKTEHGVQEDKENTQDRQSG